jgi:hypothetical protein
MGWWEQQLLDSVTAAEARLGRTLTKEEVLPIANKLLETLPKP